MEAHGNEYVAQLLDRAANLISSEWGGTTDTEGAHWLREYHQEKARFGQPAGSPAYAATRGAVADGANQPRETGTKPAKAAPRAKKG